MTTLAEWVQTFLPLLPSADALDNRTLNALYRRLVVQQDFIHPDAQAERLWTVLEETRALLNTKLGLENYEAASDDAKLVFDELGFGPGIDVYLSNYDDREQNPIPEPLDELVDALLHMEAVDSIMEQINWDGLALLFVNNFGSRLRRWREDLWRYDPPLAEIFEEAFLLLYDRLQKDRDERGTSATSRILDIDPVIPPKLQRKLGKLDERMEALRHISYIAVGQHYRDALAACRKPARRAAKR
jgi:hypothetical protein